MKYLELHPTERLQPYIKHYFYFESDKATTLEDTVFPNGHMEVIFNLGAGQWQSAVNDGYQTTPAIELWGQITRPLPIRSLGKHNMLGIRFFTHSAACFFKEAIWELNDQIADARDLLGGSVADLYEQLQNTAGLKNRIALIERYLLHTLQLNEKQVPRIDMIGQIIKELQHDTLPDSIRLLASKYNLTPRYLQKLFLQYTGFTPKFYHKISRFQYSLKLINKGGASLTAIAYDCGYFDQSHFIREFKFFTGVTPKEYTPEAFPVSNLLSNI